MDIRRAVLGTLILLVMLPLSVRAQSSIYRINVVGNKQVSRNYIIGLSGLEVGKSISSLAIEDAIKRMYKSGYFNDVIIRTENLPEGVSVEIEVKEAKTPEKITFKGNKHISTKKLKEKLTVSENSPVPDYKLFESKQKILTEYEKKGYPNAEVKTHFEEKAEKTTLVFDVKEGKKIRIKRITFIGNSAFSDRKLRRQIDTKQKSLFRKGIFIEDKLEEDKLKLQRFYRERGYITAQVQQDSVYTINDGNWLAVDITLFEGPQFKMGEITVSGESLFTEDELKDKFKLKRGDIFKFNKYEKSIADIYFAYQEEGYIYAQIADERRLRGDTADVQLSIQEGIQAHVHRINITGNEKTYDKVIRREMVLYPGDVFRRSKFLFSQRNIYYLNYFDDVVPDFAPLDNGDVDITIDVKEKAVGKFQVGVSYNARDKFYGTISIGWPNVLGRGYTLNLDWDFGTSRQSFNLGFTDPWFLDTPTSVGFDIYNTLSHWTGYYTEQRRGGAVRLGRRLSFPDKFFRAYLSYKLEQISYFDFSSSYAPPPYNDLREKEWPIVGSKASVAIERDSRDLPMFASEGNLNSYSIETSGGFLGGDENFIKQTIKSYWYLNLYKKIFVGVGKCRLGFLTNPWGSTMDIPFGERYFAGGTSFDGQIRGYEDRSICPIGYTEPVYDSTVTPDMMGRYPVTRRSYAYQMGGEAISVFSLELRTQLVKGQLYFSIFADAGNSWKNYHSMKLNDLYRSAGAGVRLIAPMLGVIGFDFAYGFDYPGSKGEWHYHFQVGPEM